MAKKRERVIKIRVFEEEYAELKHKSTKAELATWMREFCLGKETQKKDSPTAVDPNLLRQLAGIGNNLNQITRKINASDKTALEKIQIITTLSKIEDNLKAISDKQNS